MYSLYIIWTNNKGDNMKFNNVFDMYEAMRDHAVENKCGFIPADGIEDGMTIGYISTDDSILKTFGIGLNELKISATKKDSRSELVRPFFSTATGRQELCRLLEKGVLPWELKVADVLQDLMKTKHELKTLKDSIKSFTKSIEQTKENS